MKKWSYKEITEATKREIERCQRMASEMEGELKLEIARLYHYRASGAVSLWDSITEGWRENGDGERMKALLKWE
jgi:hypothetical protein